MTVPESSERTLEQGAEGRWPKEWVSRIASVCGSWDRRREMMRGEKGQNTPGGCGESGSEQQALKSDGLCFKCWLCHFLPRKP